ncbi:ImuA family protein [Blastomonas sp.]|uniref:ImuA family protein n=1 Tax=Blastomonas sp. TaxID=1909299 RepID=UPI00391A3FF8
MSRPESLESLKTRIAGIERARAVEMAAVAGTGHLGIDTALGGGLARGRVHEVFAAQAEDAGCAAGFVAGLALRLGLKSGGTLVWLREIQAEKQGGRLHAPGLVEIGLDPARVIIGVLPDPLCVLRAAADVVRCPEVGVAVIELWREPRLLDLTASRRLALAAETSGVTVIALRIAASPSPSAAQTRWQVSAAPSLPMEANAPGYPAWRVELLRQRGRPSGGDWRVEWNREQACFANADTASDFGSDAGGFAAIAAAPSGAVLPFSAGRPVDPPPRLRHAG